MDHNDWWVMKISGVLFCQINSLPKLPLSGEKNLVVVTTNNWNTVYDTLTLLLT